MGNKVYQVPYGTKDILPGEMKARRGVENAIIGVFDKWGYDEVKTPEFEYAETFGSAGTEVDFRLFDRKNNLMVLRNDMTAPIARMTATRLREGEAVKRLCYLANLYRYEEIQAGRQCQFEQAGVELIGASGPVADAEVIVLAAEALKAAGLSQFSIIVGNVDFINGLAEEAGFNAQQTKELKSCLRRHDAVAMQEMANSIEGLSEEIKEIFADFLFLQGGKELLVRLQAVVKNEKCLAALDNLMKIYELLEAYEVAEYVSLDLGLYRSLDYYTGMLFEVYLPELGYPIAGGGRYDKMMEDFGVHAPSTGFALGVDRIMLALERNGSVTSKRSFDVLVAWAEGKLPEAIKRAASLRAEGRSVKLATVPMTIEEAAAAVKECYCNSLVLVEQRGKKMDEYITIALPKGKLFKKSVDMLAKVGYSAENVVEDSRKLVISNDETKVRFIIAKTVDVPTYVEYGAADIGIIGKDVLNEQGKDVVELLDLNFGRCRLMMAVPEATRRPNLKDYAHTRAATKYPNCAKRYFDKVGIQVELVKLNGSIELGPIVGLSESIIDIVETGTTLRENKLVEIDSVFTATARLIANRASFKLKFDRLHKLVKDLRVVVAEAEKAKK